MNRTKRHFAVACMALLSMPALAGEAPQWREQLARSLHGDIAEQGNHALRHLHRDLRSEHLSAQPRPLPTPLAGFGAPPRAADPDQS